MANDQLKAEIRAQIAALSASVETALNLIPADEPPPPPPPVDAFPAWRKGLAANKLHAIAGSEPKNLAGLYPSAINAFSGLATDHETGRVYSLAGGGHSAGGDWNFVAGVDLMADAPKWAMLRTSSGDSAGMSNAAYFPDGRPTGAHNYYNCHVIRTTLGSVGLLRVKNSYASNVGNAPLHTDCFWLDKMDWDLNGEGWPAYAGAGGTGAMCMDPRDQAIYTMSEPTKFRVFNPIARTWANWQSNGEGLWATASIVIPELNAIVMDYGNWKSQENTVPGHAGLKFSIWRMGAQKHEIIQLKWLTPKPQSFWGNTGFAYDPTIRRIYWWVRTALMRVNIDTWEVEYIADTPLAVGVSPWNKMGYIPALKGIYLVPEHKQPVLFMPTTLDPVQPPVHEPIATVNGKDQTLQAGIDAGAVVTIGEGVLLKGGAISKPVNSVIKGAGSDNTRIAGAVVDKGVLVYGSLLAGTTHDVSDLTIEDAKVADGNGAGIRHSSGLLRVADVDILRCQNGYMGNADVEFLRVVFDGNGTEDGRTHAVYAGDGAKLMQVTACIFKNTQIGHHIKSRAAKSVLQDVQTHAGTESYSCDFPWGGVVEIDQLTAIQGGGTDHPVMINYGSETNPNQFTEHSLRISDTTLTSNDVPNAIGIRIDAKTPITAVLTNVHFVGIKTPVVGNVIYNGCTRDGMPL